MNGTELKTQLLGFGDLDVEDATIISWIDECQKQVSIDLPIEHTVTYTNVTANETKTIVDGVINLLSATVSGINYDLSNIVVTPTTLTFLEALTSVTVKYTSPVDDYISLTQELTIHPLLHSCTFFFLISMYFDSDGEGDTEESNLAERYYRRWLYFKDSAIATILGGNSSTSTREPVKTTDAMYKRNRGLRPLIEEDPFYE
jgi:hypothetical protein